MAWPKPADKATQTGFAQLVGVSQQAVSKMVEKGVLAQGGTYREWLDSYLDRLRTEASGRDQDDRLSSARIRDTEMAANLKEMDYLDRLGKVVWVDDIGPALLQLCGAFQFHVMAAKERIIESIESRYSIQLNDDEDIGKHLRAALESVASGAGELERTIAPGRCGADTASTDVNARLGTEVPQAAGRE